MKPIEQKAEAYANSVPTPWLPPEPSQIILNAIKQAYLDGVKEGEYRAEVRHADGVAVASCNAFERGRKVGRNEVYSELNSAGEDKP